ncbi:hypothetical protein WJX75_004135 [Coccomyxa subellipsoidea]|uniref:Uncharacterized protein n=1 Tax=Coccomyxa subellipsoidea TaxID=248742 RepID=A0ABR2YI02_9CHLO
MNNNKVDEPALLAHCKGVFSKSGYINVGTQENPLPYKVPAAENDDTKAKPIYTQPPKSGRTPEVYFEKQHLFVSKDLPYVDRIRYAETQPEKLGKGFLTSDYSKRDEFTSTFRTEQYRSLLKQEEKHARKALQNRTADNSAEETDVVPPARKEVFQFDLVFFDDLKLATSKSSKLKKDTCNPTVLSRDRQFGTYKTACQLSYIAPQAVQPPQHGHRPVIESTFYRKSMLSLFCENV